MLKICCVTKCSAKKKDNPELQFNTLLNRNTEVKRENWLQAVRGELYPKENRELWVLRVAYTVRPESNRSVSIGHSQFVSCFGSFRFQS